MGARTTIFGIVIVSFLLLLSACSESPTGQLIKKKPGPKAEEQFDTFISALELQNIVNNKEVRIVDLREAWKYNSGHIPNSVNVPFSEITSFRLQAEAVDKEFRVIIYDETGMRSQNAYSLFENIGYKKVQILEGGYDSWLEKELVVEQSY